MQSSGAARGSDDTSDDRLGVGLLGEEGQHADADAGADGYEED